MVKIITDTTSCLSPEIALRYEIPVIPQIINFGNDSYYEGIDMDIATFMKRLKTSSELPKTAAPSPDRFAQEFSRMVPSGETILCIHAQAEPAVLPRRRRVLLHPRGLGIGDASGNFGYLDRKAIDEAGLKMLFAERPTVIGGHAFTTGMIPRETFERVLSPTRMTVGVRDGVGCFPDQLAPEKRTMTVVPDVFQHEQATAFNVKGRGLVVMTSCGHRGVVNSARTAMKISGVNKVHAILGGFHLAPHAADYQRQTALAIKELNPDYLIPMHCSGEVFISIAMQELGDKVIRSSTGTRFIFGA